MLLSVVIQMTLTWQQTWFSAKKQSTKEVTLCFPLQPAFHRVCIYSSKWKTEASRSFRLILYNATIPLKTMHRFILLVLHRLVKFTE